MNAFAPSSPIKELAIDLAALAVYIPLILFCVAVVYLLFIPASIAHCLYDWSKRRSARLRGGWME